MIKQLQQVNDFLHYRNLPIYFGMNQNYYKNYRIT